MRQNPGPAELSPQQDEVTVGLSGGADQAASEQGPPADGVTVLVPGAVLAPAPSPEVAGAGETPVFVDDSGNRKRLLRPAGVLMDARRVGGGLPGHRASLRGTRRP